MKNKNKQKEKIVKILIVLANPNRNSFCKAIAKTAARALKKEGASVVLHDLYAEKFPPVLTERTI